MVALGEANRTGTLECIEVQSEPECWRTFLAGLGGRLTLKPDLFVRIAVPGSTYEDRWYIEVDLATEAMGTILAKAKRYLAHYRSGSEPIHPRVLWAVPDAHRAERIHSALGRLPAEAQRMFSVCLLGEVVKCLTTEAHR